MSRRSAALSRTLSGLLSGALILTTLQLAAAPATAAPDPDPDHAVVLEAARSALPDPPAPPSGAADENGIRPEIAELAEGAGAEGADAPMEFLTQTLPDSAPSAELVAEGATLRGTVTDTAGVPIEGIDVRVNGWVAGTHGPVAGYQTVTAADGTWSFAGIDVTADEWFLSFDDPEGRFAWQNWDGATWYREPTPLRFAAGDVVENLDATLFRVAEISGTVSGGHRYFGSEYLFTYLYAFDRDQSAWYLVDWRDATREYSFGSLAPDFYAVGVSYSSNRGRGLAFSDVTWVDEGDRLDVDLTVRHQHIGPSRDFSGDWVPDVLAITSTGALRMYRGDAGGGWLGTSTIGSGWDRMNTVFQAGDFSGDGYSDVMARDSSGNLYLYRGDGRGGWSGSAKVGTGWGAFTSVFAPGDFDGDGNVDVMARDRAGQLHLYRGDGAGGWSGRSTVGWGWQGFTTLIGPGDFSGDGFPDVLARDSAGRLWLYPGNGSGGWLAKRQVGSGWQNFTAVVAGGDLWNNDGFPEVIARDAFGRLFAYPANGAGGWVGMGLGVRIGHGWNGLRIVG